LTTWHCILSAELTKNADFFGDFAHWVSLSNLMYINKYLFV